MNTVWAFGDSFTARYNENDWWGKEYIKYKGYKPKVYSELIAEKMNMEERNFAFGGSDNYSIFQLVCDNINDINDGDVVIIGWAPTTRFRVYDEQNKRFAMINSKSTALSDNDIFISNLTNKTINEIHINRLDPIYESEILSWEKIIKRALKNNIVYFWKWSNNNQIDVNDYECICNETNNLITDCHWSEDGHRKFSEELFYTLIKKGM